MAASCPFTKISKSTKSFHPNIYSYSKYETFHSAKTSSENFITKFCIRSWHGKFAAAPSNSDSPALSRWGLLREREKYLPSQLGLQTFLIKTTLSKDDILNRIKTLNCQFIWLTSWIIRNKITHRYKDDLFTCFYFLKSVQSLEYPKKGAGQCLKL